MNFEKNKKGGIGGFLVMFWATIVIVLILTVFVIGSGLIKKASSFDNNAAGAGVYIYNETDVGVDDVFVYADNYQKFVEAKYLIESGSELESALRGSGYEK